ncbi:MAG: hypothetical protein HLUCCA01_10145 [Bacteroidetes bacterium HLUCCA01]|nr:MAG: hypothetical protein HLUCCA01_10145 [Bacteroidetes bacterium HLUCCA01]
MNPVKLTLIALAAVAISACSVVSPIVGDYAARLVTSKESDFGNMSVSVITSSNLDPIDKIANTRSQQQNWIVGGNAVAILATNPRGIGLVNFDGEVIIDGEPATVMSLQNFRIYEAGVTGTKNVIMRNTAGQELNINVTIPPDIRITAVNDQSPDAVTLDLREPVTLQLEYDAALEGKIATVSLVSDTGLPMGTHLYNNVASFAVASQVTIPAGAFRNPHTTGGITLDGTSKMKYREDGYLRIKVSQVEHPQNNPGFAEFRVVQDSYDTVPLTITAQPEGIRNSSTVRAKRTVEGVSGEYGYFASVANGYHGVPLSGAGTRMGIASLSVTADLYEQTSSTTSRENYFQETITYTTITTTFQFPQLDDAFWDQFLSNVHGDITTMLQNNGLTVVPTERFTSSPVYDEFFDVREENTQRFLSKKYGQTNRLVPSGLSETLGNMEAVNFMPEVGRDIRLLNDAGADAYLSVDLNFQVAGGPDDTIVLLPRLNYIVTGRSIGGDGAVSAFANGTIAGPGVPFSEADFEDLNGLDRATQRVRLMEFMKESLDGLMQAQNDMHATEAWAVAPRF